MTRFLKLLVTFALALVVAACGGSGSSSPGATDNGALPTDDGGVPTDDGGALPTDETAP